MRKIQSVLLGAALCVFARQSSHAVEATWDYAVQVSATVQTAPAKISLSWPQDTTVTPSSYTVYRKGLTDTSWGSGVTLPGTTTSYVDTSVAVGSAYEYEIVKNTSLYNGYGYIYAGINAPLTESRGKLVLLVDNTFSTSLSNELAQLQQDLLGDGWTVLRHDVSRTDTPPNIKALIQTDYNADPANVQAVFLFGHVPVPYSGDIVPDGHIPNHQGAWPADCYYGNMHGTWTDTSVNDTGADDVRNHNVPGDGKFDQSQIPGTVELMVGRVDLANLPGQLTWGGPATFPSELQLLRNYLNKDHKFRFNQMNLPRRGLVGDYFGIRSGEAFAASAWRNFAPFFGANNIDTLPNEGTFLPTLGNNAYLWAYGCGAGSFSSVGGIGNTGQYNDGTTTDLYASDAKAAFLFLFGSWLGDWDSQDDIMRGVLALPTYGLACGWSGRPHWFLQHMALGMPIGYGVRLTQNNTANGLYQNQINSAAGDIHVALMGDPTLRMHTVSPAGSLAAGQTSSGIKLSWTASASSVAGYHVYRASSMAGPFTRLTTSLLNATSFVDTAGTSSSVYMVRAVKLETSASGTYYNPSQGVFTSLNGITTTPPPVTTTNTPPPVTSTNTPPPVTNTNTTTGSVAASGNTIWLDDSTPAGAVLGTAGGDTWNWISSNPTPFSGKLAHQSAIASGMHQHYFDWSGTTLAVSAGSQLFTYVYVDPANPPSEIMLEWNNGTWEHRAYWGANSIANGTDGTVSRYHVGAMPATGQWVPLVVPASAVGLEGSNLRGMTFTLYGGRATFDNTGTGPVGTTTTTNTPPPVTSTNTPPPVTVTNTPPPSGAGNTVWLEDATPAGAVLGTAGGDSWNWISSNPAPFSGKLAHQSAVASGMHQHYFDWSGAQLNVNTGDQLYTYVYLDPANPPSEIMLEWNNGTWEHRAYWGANSIANGTDGTVSRYHVGAMPATGQWVPLVVPASAVGLEGSSLRGMTFTLYGGRATFDYTGSGPASAVTNTPPPVTSTNTPPPVTVTNTPPPSGAGNTVWLDDATPSGAVLGTTGGDSWNWISSNPAPFSGKLAHQSAIASGMHQHYFDWSGTQLNVNTGDQLYTYVYLDPANPPSEIMLEWNNGTWEHRAYWGANSIANGTDGTVSRYHVGAMPATGQWVPLVVPASAVGLEGSSLRGMTFTLYGGRATFDYTGSGSASAITNTTPPVTTTNSPPPVTGTNTPPPATGSNNVPPIVFTNAPPGTVSPVDDTTLHMPQPGENTLHILSPSLLELVLINTKQPDPAQVSQWNFVDSSGNLHAPSASQLSVTINGQPATIQSIGFKRRPLYAALNGYDLRIENSLYVQLTNTIADNATVVVKNTDGTLWSSSMQFTATANPFRFNPAIHVNQEGYVPSMPKKAMVGYYLGSMGEMYIPPTPGFALVDANSGKTVYQGVMTSRPDTGWTYSPTPYQKVLMADFSSFTNAGEYQLVIPGHGASLPFLINDGIAMSFARAYALGLYEQRCGTNNAMPYTRFTHDACHTAPATVPVPESSYAFTWNTIASYNGGGSANPNQTAPQLKSDATSLFPFVNKGTIDTRGGHHDAGDYSKYTINVASLIHFLMFSVDSIPGVAALDNLGIPESGDGISDVMQEAKWEADYLCKLQDADGGFYFLVYPMNREYESNVTPDHGDPQVVWPKNTVATASAVAALAQCASSPLFKKTYPAAAAMYLQKAKLGWSLLTNAIAKYGRTGAYQKLTFYGDDFQDQDELAWAACEMYLATGDPAAHQDLLSWFNPNDPNTYRWGWVHMFQCYGNANRSYAFAVKSGRMQASQLNAAFLAKCQAEVTAAANDALLWSQQSAYGTSFPQATKAVNGAGWYFSDDQAFDIAVAYQLTPRADYLDAIIANMNYEGGCNPVNVTYLTGLGWKRQRIIVSQYADNDGRTMPPTGMPIGNVQDGFPYLSLYQSELGGLCYPSDGAGTAPYPFYDRWADTWNVSTEMVDLDLARGLADLAFLATLTPTKAQAYTAQAGTISMPSQTSINTPVTATFQPPAGMTLDGARVVWEAAGQEPAYGTSYTFTPTSTGSQWVEAEAQWPDGRRAFARSGSAATNNLPTVSVAATVSTASRSTGSLGVWTLTRTGDTSAALTVNFQFTGSAAKWTDYRRPQGDMPESLTIPAGSASATLSIYAVPGTTWTGTETAILNLSQNAAYNVGTPAIATITLN